MLTSGASILALALLLLASGALAAVATVKSPPLGAVASKTDHNHESSSTKFAYVTLLCSRSEADQAAHIRMILVLKESIRQFDKENDIVTMVHGSMDDEKYGPLLQEGINVVPVGDIGKMVSDPEPLRVPDDVSACFRSKLNVLKLTQYERVVFVDADALVKKDLHFMFEQEGFLAYEGFESPLNTGLFALTPSLRALNDIEEIFASDSFHPQDGWRGYGKFPHWRLEGHTSDWSFWCAHSDQGILYYYYDKVLEDATIRSQNEGAEVITHFTGWNKPMLHKHSAEADHHTRGKEDDSQSQWYKLWQQVSQRVDGPFIEPASEMADSTEKLKEHTSQAMRGLDVYGEPDFEDKTKHGLHVEWGTDMNDDGTNTETFLFSYDFSALTDVTKNLAGLADSVVVFVDEIKAAVMDGGTESHDAGEGRSLEGAGRSLEELIMSLDLEDLLASMGLEAFDSCCPSVAGSCESTDFDGVVTQLNATHYQLNIRWEFSGVVGPSDVLVNAETIVDDLEECFLDTGGETNCTGSPIVSLYDADNDTFIESLGATVDACTNYGLTLVAGPSCKSQIKLKLLDANGTVVAKATEKNAPFSLGADIDDEDDLLPVDVLKVPGSYVLSVNPKPGAKEYFHFTVNGC